MQITFCTVRTRLPIHSTHAPEQRDEVWAEKARRLQQKQKVSHDRTATALVPLQDKDVVRMEGPRSWNRRAVVLQQVAPRSYNVMTENGDVFRRNRRHLLKTAEPWQPQVVREDDLRLENRLNEQEIGARAQRDEGHDSDNLTEVPCHADEMVGDTSEMMQQAMRLRRSERTRKPVVKLDL